MKGLKGLDEIGGEIGKKRERIMRRGEKADVGGKLESAKKCDKKEEGGDYQLGPSETLQREKEKMETRLKEIATGQKNLNLKRE